MEKAGRRGSPKPFTGTLVYKVVQMARETLYTARKACAFLLNAMFAVEAA